MGQQAKHASGAAEWSDKYDHRRLEPKWQATWYQTRIYEPDLESAAHPFYNLMMFPYPSAEGLHVGNLFAFIGADIYGRFMAMNGMDVFEPIGFDAFGIHSENYAIKQGIHPEILTARNVERFRERQLKPAGNRYDWQHEVITTDPAYYKWTQWIFLQLYKAGLAERKKAAVNWCPRCKTVLADEQVINALCERCDTPVIQRELEQWFFKITKYADRLLDHLETLDWSEVIKTAQRNWIRRSEGLKFELGVEGKPELRIQVFTTRPDTVYGVTYVVLAPEHRLVDALTTAEFAGAVQAYCEEVRHKSELDRMASVRAKTGVFTGSYAINPANQERVPIWVADYVLAAYGAGAIMAVPAHDERDFEFAQAFGLPIRQVVAPAASDGSAAAGPAGPAVSEAYLGEGVLINAAEFSGMLSQAAGEQIIAWFERNGTGERAVQYRLRDWLISRQRYWGPPIPIIYCEKCGIVPVPEEQLPVILPHLEDWLPKGTGSSPLAASPSFVNTSCPACGRAARRETDVSDNFLDSAWYFLRYPSAHLSDRPFDAELTAKWLPVDMYIGGPEHSVLHLLYSRFITMALHDLGYLAFDEPFTRFRAHGLITRDGAKMSKSHGNVVNPDHYIAEYGADTLRMYLMFLGPYDQAGDFSDKGIGGIRRFLNRSWELVARHAGRLDPTAAPTEHRRRLHRTIQKVTDDVRELRYNTAIAALMEYRNGLQPREVLHGEEIESFLLMLAPFAPHMTEELWQRLGKPYSIHQQPWPAADPKLLVLDTVTVAVQVNGRTRGLINITPAADQEAALAAARELPSVRQHLGRGVIRRVVYVPGRILNIIV